MNILVTGAAGYFGSVLVFDLLRQGHAVRGVDALFFGEPRITVAEFSRHYDFVRADLRDRAAVARVVEGMDAVVHLAALVGHPICDGHPETSQEINVGVTAHLIDAARSAGVPRFLLASTCSNYGITPAGVLADESTPLKPVSIYAETKVQAERCVLGAAAAGFDAAVFRFATLFGLSPRMRFDLLLNELTRDAWLEGRIVLRGADTWRPFIHLDDASRAVQMWLAAPDAGTSGQAVNIGGLNLRKRDVGDLLAHHVPRLRIDVADVDSDGRDYSVSLARASSVLGFTAARTAEEGITAVLHALQAGEFDHPMSHRYTNVRATIG